ncbi:MAG TPA: zinc ABC transporter solute-binding protein [Bacillus bacterium]|nr:zinc ABC transporter solute-binding protein [Bacillus sp. (in: firmicutes)]
MRRNFIRILLLILVMSTFMIGCSQNKTETEQKKEQTESKLKIYTTLFPIEDFAKKIGGSHVDVNSIIPLGTNAHTYEPTTKTMIGIAKGDAFIFSNKSMEPYAVKIADALKNENVKIVDASKGIEMIAAGEESAGNHNESHGTETGHEEGHDHGDVDPHIWLDPILSVSIAKNITASLVELKPEAAEEFEANFNKLRLQLEELDGRFTELVKGKTAPKILVSHAGFGYWQNRYGIKQISITGLSSTNEPSQQGLQHIIDLAKENNIKYIIFEQNITPKVAEIIKNEIHAESLRIHNLSVLTEDDIKNNEDYFSLMNKNIETLKIALE